MKKGIKKWFLVLLFSISFIASIFELPSVAQTNILTTLYTFTNGTDGTEPVGTLLLSGNSLFGAAFQGGSNNDGTIFGINTNGGSFRVLHTFNYIDGSSPFGALVLVSNTLYGTTTSGGINGDGTIFSINTNGTGFTNLFNFNAPQTGFSATLEGLVYSSNVLYGTQNSGGTNNNGVLYRFDIATATITILDDFPTPSSDYSKGANPTGLAISDSGVLFGITATGPTGNGSGAGNGDVIFSMNTKGSNFTVLYTFTNGISGYNPTLLLLYSNVLYGETGGSGVFLINTDGSGFTNLLSFDGTSLAFPIGGLVLNDKTLYGSTYLGGANTDGAVFSVRTNGGCVTVLYNFSSEGDGSNPEGAVVVSSNLLFGTSSGGSSSGHGTIFSIGLVPPAPSLVIATAPTNQVTISWPTNYWYYQLQFTTNINPPVVWSPVSTSPVIVSNIFVVTNQIYSDYSSNDSFIRILPADGGITPPGETNGFGTGTTFGVFYRLVSHCDCN